VAPRYVVSVPTVCFGGETIEVPTGTTLRTALLEAGLTPHNGRARWLNCKGLGSCGTCAVEIEGDAGDLTVMERWRLDFPPHERSHGLRLACQVRVHADLAVTKHPGFWGQDVPDPESGG
jgi:ferredoxin